MRRIFSPYHGRHMLVGSRQRPVSLVHKNLFSTYHLPDGFPIIPDTFDYSPQALVSLKEVLLNDQLGCCVIAGAYHVIGTATGNSGNIFVPTDEQIINDYSAIGGYDPNSPDTTDNGCDEETALKWWETNGFADGSKLQNHLGLDPSNPAELLAACYLFENLYFGVEMPDAWINPFPDTPGFVWDVAGDAVPDNGHCFIACTGDGVNKTFTIDTWGMLGKLTFNAIAKYCAANVGGMVYVLLTPDMIAKGQEKAPNGFNWEQLVTDFPLLKG